jgi:GAF domain-containing protein/anti-sigma regulatory factor (Ser/Thr protein kinase)
LSQRAKPAPRAIARRKSGGSERRRAAAPKIDQRHDETLEQLQATAEILRIISRSPSDAQPVFDTIAAAALRLCRASSANVFTYDGNLVHLAALVNLTPEGADAIRSLWPRPPSRELGAGRAILTRRIVEIPDVAKDADFTPTAATAVAGNFRSVLAVPLMREGDPIGAIAVGRPEAGAFPPSHVALLRTFADQAVIAIENVRLFSEVQSRNRHLVEALEQQTATSEILRVISGSRTEVAPVFETIAASALKLCGATSANVLTFDGELLHIGALAVADKRGEAAVRGLYPRAPGRDSASSRAVLTGALVAIPDILDDPEYKTTAAALAGGFRSLLSIPLLQSGRPIGAIVVGRAEPGPFPPTQVALLQTFADQAIIAIENVRLFNELDARNCDLTEALEHQTATSEILRVISQSPTDAQPVFDTIAAAALKLCGGRSVTVLRYDGEVVDMAAFASLTGEEADAIRRLYPARPSRSTVASRAVLTHDVVNIPDVLEDPDYAVPEVARSAGYRSVLGVPLLRHGSPIGAIGVARTEPGYFPDELVSLLKTFADQAVIAIENVRLFTELEGRNHALNEALEQQTATSEILRAISSSPTHLPPVLEAVVSAAARFCGAPDVMLLRIDGDVLRGAAGVGQFAEIVKSRTGSIGALEIPITRGSISGRAVVDCRSIHVHDLAAETEDEYPIGRELQRRYGHHSCLTTPLLREGEPLGVIAMFRMEVDPFSEKQIALLQTFADQAVIAIENVRLFNELEGRNRDLSEALEQQTATAEILQVISSSPTDLQPVLDTIVRNAARLCGATFARVLRFDGELLHFVATSSADPDFLEVLRKHYPMRPDPSQVAGRVILRGAVVAIEDALADPEYAHDVAVAGRLRRMLGVPMMREGKPLGVIAVGWSEPGPVAKVHEELLKSFADQAVIAIENVRLFNELKARTGQLTRSVNELRALGEVGRAVSSTLNLETVLSTIVSRATELAGLDGGSIWEYDDAREEFHLHATNRLPHELVDVLRGTPIRKGQGALGRLAVSLEPVEIADIANERSYPSRLREILTRFGYRSVLAVPLLREDQLLGALAVNRGSPGGFAPEVVDLMKTFATQSALAIQNARLFREIEQKSRELEAASRHKSEFLANMSHELRTPLNAVIGFSEVLQEQLFGPTNDKQAEYIRDILESGRHLLSLINDILDLSKIEAGRMELEASEFDLPGTIENALILVRERAGRHGIQLVHDVDRRLGSIRADQRKVKQVLLNLLTNALKFTPDGGRVEVRARVVDGVAEISVADTGVGIAPEDQATVFEEFRQVGTAAKKVEGTGLGLAISRRFIELHGGRIWLTSRVGAGSTFAFTLPLPSTRD